MIQRIQHLGRGQRILLFILLFGGGLLLIGAITVLLILLGVNNSPREVAQALAEGVTVTEFAQLPDDDAYPAAVAAVADGTIYTGSYATGAVWRISPDGSTLTELPNTRERIGSVAGLDVGPDGALYILDRLNSSPGVAGGVLWRIAPDSEDVVDTGFVPDDTRGFVSPHSLTVDANGAVYVTDRGRHEVWRFTPEGAAVMWWQVPGGNAEETLPTGIAYDPSTGTVLISEFSRSAVYRVGLDGSTIEELYSANNDGPGFDGLAVAPDGTVYVAALGSRTVERLTDDLPQILASGFRGVSDVAYAGGRLIATNFDQRSLVVPGITPQLPFALDVINLPAE
ncbi:MAG: hypothetical protein OHK0046_35530 [Anaerolineae bacterium]